MNNTGVAHLIGGFPEDSIKYFDKGLDYTAQSDRIIQRISLMSNKLIAHSYCFDDIKEVEFHKILNVIFDNSELQNIPFITARYVSWLELELRRTIYSTATFPATVWSQCKLDLTERDNK